MENFPLTVGILFLNNAKRTTYLKKFISEAFNSIPIKSWGKRMWGDGIRVLHTSHMVKPIGSYHLHTLFGWTRSLQSEHALGVCSFVSGLFLVCKRLCMCGFIYCIVNCVFILKGSPEPPATHMF